MDLIQDMGTRDVLTIVQAGQQPLYLLNHPTTRAP